ncbi:TonB-dependent receptor [Larkinella sp. VNQ87]|uniref:TonB-dependent receptor n=1 Tax=Larkinella sp. VNQ87 TaxID=3400921 RepID=UPI003C0F2562
MQIRSLLFTLALALLTALASAQTAQRGTLAGRITDENGYLPGATVLVKGTTLGASTDLNGSFQLPNVPAGSVVLAISYVGYQTVELPLSVRAGLNEVPVVKLSAEGTQLADVIVKGTIAGSQMKAISIKRNALAMMDVLASDAIGKLPDRNAAEAVQRMPGVAVARYHGEADQATVRGTPFAWTSTLFNGTRMPSANVGGSRNAVLDAVPSEIIQYAQVVKALTPDMEGDAIGGSINFVTRVAPENRVLNVSAAGGFNNLSKDGTYNASIVYGDRFFKRKLGVMLAAAIWDRNWGTDEFTIAYNTGASNPQQQVAINSLLMKRYMGKRQTYGFNAGLEYRFNEGNRIYARGLYDMFNDIRPVYESYFAFNTSEYQLNYRYSFYQTRINGLELGGEHQLSNKLKLDYLFSDYTTEYYLNKTPNTTSKDLRGLPIATFRQKLTKGYGGLASDGRKYLSFDSPDGTGDDALGIRPYLVNPVADAIDPAKLTLRQLVLLQFGAKERDQVGQVNLKFDASPKFSLKVGAKFRHKERSGRSTSGSRVYVPTSSTLVALNTLEREPFPTRGGFFNELGNPYDAYAIDNITEQQLYNLYAPGFLQANGFRDVTPGSFPTTYSDGREDVLAGYVMGEWNASEKLKIFGGLRDEYTMLTANGSQYRRETVTVNGAPTVRESITPVTVKNNYHALLPMLHAKYALNQRTNLRAAFTRTFVRPLFTELTPTESINTTTNPITVSKGNAELRPTFANNFDLMGEHYFDNIGLLTAGLFYKDITDVVFSDRSVSLSGNVTTVTTQPQNLRNASLMGFEVGLTRRFTFLPGFLSGFGIEANYTRIESEVEVPRSVGSDVVMDKTPLPNQSRHLFNGILFYERNGLTARLAGNYRGKSVETISQQLGPRLYTWSNTNFTVDFSASYTITPKIRVFVEVNNLTNEPLQNYLGDERRITNSEWYSQRGQAGIRWDIF